MELKEEVVELQFIASQAEVQMTTWDLLLASEVCVCGGGGGKSCGTWAHNL